MGQTKRCINNHIAEHKRAVASNSQNSEIVRQVGACNGCKLLWNKTTMLARERDAAKRILMETIKINSTTNCISNPSTFIN